MMPIIPSRSRTPTLIAWAIAANLALTLASAAADQPQTATGIVFHDTEATGEFDPHTDRPLPGVAVSNGRDIAVTDADGRYNLPVRGHTVIFVIKPSGYTVPVDDHQIPRFYYVHSPEGAAGTRYDGLGPTGPLPDSIDFPLRPADEPDRFDVLVFGDTQPRDIDEVHHIAHDAVADLIGIDAAFGVTLGDLAFDDLTVFDPLNEVLATIGIPWRHIIGNHDIDFTADNDTDTRGPYYRTYGPSYYAFAHGPAHFIVVDNIRWIVDGDRRYYRTGLGDDQLRFLRNELDRIDDDRLVVFMMHIPWVGSTPWADEDERQALLDLLAEQPNALSLVAHTHRHYHHFIGPDDGLTGADPHHMISIATACGAWWTGAPDEYGIPHAMMSDGTPAGHALLHVDGPDWKLSYRASRRPAHFQMHIHAPDAVPAAEVADTQVVANIFNALPDADVRLRVGDGPWTNMRRTVRTDPVREAARRRERAIEDAPWRPLGDARDTPHIWQATLGESLAPGAHVIEVRANDAWWSYQSRRILRVTP